MSPQKKLSLFLLLTVILSSLSYIPLLRAGTIGVQGELFVFTMTWSPGLAAILTQIIATRSLRAWAGAPGRPLGFELPTSYRQYMLYLSIRLLGSRAWESFQFAWLTLKSGSLWPAVLLHATQNQFIMGIFDKLTANTNAAPYITGEFGVGLALTRVIVACFCWRTQIDKTLQTEPVRTQPVVQPK